MPTDVDFDELDEETQTSSTPSKTASESAIIADLKRRISSRDTKLTEVQKELNRLKEQLIKKDTDEAVEAASLRAQLSDLQGKLTQTSEKLSTTEQERNRLKSAKNAAEVIAEKYPDKPHLINDLLIGDLKLREDFESDESYDKYLSRQAKKVVVNDAAEEEDESGTEEAEKTQTAKPVKTLHQAMRGTVPSGNTRVIQSRTSKLDPIDIADKMMKLRADSPEYEALSKQLQEATSDY